MNPMSAIEWGAPLLEPVHDRALEKPVRDALGFLPPWTRPFLPAPWVAIAMNQLLPEQGLLLRLDFNTSDLVSLVVSQENACRYCYAASRAMLRIQGMSEERIAQLERQLAVVDLDSRRAAMVRFARRMARANPVLSPRDLEPLRQAGIDAEEIREIAYVVAATTFLNRANSIAASPVRFWERLPERWWIRALGPLKPILLERLRKRGHARAQTAESESPYRSLFRAYAGSPIGPRLNRIVDAMWASPVLSRRSKALMIAMIGRSLGCELSARAARRVLDEEGMAEADIDQVLAHAGGPQISEEETRLVNFARDSVWYEIAHIQRRSRELRARLSAPAFVETLGVVSLANAICRLATVLAEPA
jgi:AhpD family alkylhydroperoxidase